MTTQNTIHSTIVHGDCLKVMKKLPDNSIDFICSDLPYNISGKGGTTFSSTKGFIPAYFGDWDSWPTEEAYFDFVFTVCQEYQRILKPNASMVLFLSYYTGGWLAHELHRRKLFTFKSPLIFSKENPVPKPKCNGFRPSFEWAAWFVNNQNTGAFRPRVFNFLSQAEMTNVMSYKIGPGHKKSHHPTEKPEHLIKKLVEIFTNTGDIVLDSFAGGGTTAAACVQAKRRFIAIEQESRYVRMMCERLGV